MKNIHQNGPLKEQNNHSGGRSGSGISIKRRTIDANRTKGGGINRALKSGDRGKLR